MPKKRYTITRIVLKNYKSLFENNALNDFPLKARLSKQNQQYGTKGVKLIGLN